MTDVGLKMSFLPESLRVTLELRPQDALLQKEPPQSILDKARNRMESLKAAGTIVDFEVDGALLQRLWPALRAVATASPAESATPVKITIAQGTPALNGFELSDMVEAGSLLSVSFRAPAATVSQWNFRYMDLLIRLHLRKKGVNAAPHLAVLNALWLRAVAGEEVLNTPIPAMALAAGTQAFSLSAFHHGRVMVINVFDAKVFADKNRGKVSDYIEKAVAKLKGWDYELLQASLDADFKRGASGPQRLGLELPVAYLAVQGKNSEAGMPAAALQVTSQVTSPDLSPKQQPPKQQPPIAKSPATGTKPQSAPQVIAAAAKIVSDVTDAGDADYPGMGLLFVKITADRKTATIQGFRLEAYKTPGVTFDEAWITLELDRLGIKERDAKLTKRVADTMAKQRDINGLVLAQGPEGKPAEEPYLAAIFEGATKSAEPTGMRRKVRFVKVAKGSAVAEVRFRKPAEESRTIFGELAGAPPPPPFNVELKEGIEAKGLTFVATQDGIPLIETASISISATLVHEGDVNLTTGDIEFSGPLVINGTVEAGASVVAHGSISINGSVKGATVKAGGDLTVSVGISAAQIKSKGSVTALFIESSTVEASTNLTLEKALINSHVTIGGTLTMTGETGLIAGGTVAAFKGIVTPNLGFPNDIATKVMVGVPWAIVQALERAKSRMKRVRAAGDDTSRTKSELQSRGAAKTTKRHDEIKAELAKRATQVARLKGKIQTRITALKELIKYDETGNVTVHGELRQSAKVHIGPHLLLQLSDVIEVMIIAKKDGAHLVLLADAKKPPDDTGAPPAAAA